MAALFRREVPEVDDGVVQLMGVARDPGIAGQGWRCFPASATSIRVGACVGVRGSHPEYCQELHGERIDIVVGSPDIATIRPQCPGARAGIAHCG